MGGSAGRQLSTVTSGEGNSGSVDPAQLTPLERAAIYPGECCVCGDVIPMACIRCDVHEKAYRLAFWNLAMGQK